MRSNNSSKKRLKGKELGVYIIFAVWAFINLFPVYWMFTFSLKSNDEIFGSNVAGLPREWLWSNYETALSSGKLGLYFFK